MPLYSAMTILDIKKNNNVITALENDDAFIYDGRVACYRMQRKC